MIRYQVIKDGFPVALCCTPEEADECYMHYNADEIREIEDLSDAQDSNLQS